MHIAIIGSRGIPARYSGVETQVQELASGLVRSGHAVTVYCRKRYRQEAGLHPGIKLIFIPTIENKYLGTPLHVFLSTLHAVFSGADILHYHAIGPAAFSILGRLAGKKTVATIHALDWKRRKWGVAARIFLRSCEWPAVLLPHRVIAVSRELKDYLQGKYRREIIYIPSGVRDHCASRQDNKAHRGYVLFVGRLVPEKGLHLLIDVFNSLSADKKLLIAGEASFTAAYEHRLRQSAGPNIEFLGFVAAEQLEKLYRDAYLFVLPSEVEGLPLALLEAMSYGKCCLVSDIDACREVIGDCGVCFKSGDREDLRAKLGFLFKSPRFVEEIGSRAGGRVRQLYNWEHIIRETEKVYEALVTWKK